MKQALTYDDVLLVPQYSDIKSRKEVEIRNNLDKHIRLALPIISSPMDTVTESDMSNAMCDAGGLGIVHRYNTIKEQCDLARKCEYTGAAIGVTADFEERACALYDVGVRILCVDVAHGHHVLMKNALKKLRGIFGIAVHIMAGNVATLQGFNDLSDWGADSVRCNIGGGCFTAGTLIRTTQGDKPIEQVMIGDEVYTHTGNVHPVIDTLSFDRNEEIVIINGIETTTNHEFYVVNRSDLNLITDENIEDYAYWIEAERLDKSEHMLVEIV